MTYMIKKITPYLVLMRLHRPVGSWLLLWPTLIALWIAGNGSPDMKWVVIFTLGVIVMRAAGCVINDLADKEVDGHVERTKGRPLVTGEVTPQQAKWLFLGLMTLAFILILFTTPFVMALSVVGALLAISYPFLKRMTHFPQVGLGLAFAWGIPMAYAAQAQHLPNTCWILFFATVMWIIAYDTLYAMADREDDVKIGVKSTAIAFGQYDKVIVGSLQVIMLLCLVGLGRTLDFKWPYFISLLVALGLMVYQQLLIKERDRKKCLQAFLNNQWVGMVVFLGVVFGL